MDMMYYDHHHHYHHQQQEEEVEASPKVISSSTSSSPCHEFSFTISLNSKETFEPNTTKTLSSSFLDLSPADDIFFHGQLLPLHISHLPSLISPRYSTTSLELIDDDFFQEEKPPNQTKQDNNFEHQQETRANPSPKQKSFRLFGLRKWRKGCEETKEKQREDERQHRTTKRKLNFDALKRCVKMMRPFLSFRKVNKRDTKMEQFRRQSHSFPGMKKEKRGKGAMGYSSAPASIWTSPTNSGHLLASTTTMHSSSPSDSTMEELQTAIQAAIAHCKNSIATMEDDNKKC